MRKNFVLVVLLVTFISSCKKEITVISAPLDKQVTLNFPVWYWSTANPSFETLPEYSFITDFDKRDYAEVDSIIFTAGLSVDDPTDTNYVRLFDVTDNSVIANSEISTTNTQVSVYNEMQTQNIFNSLPDKKITLAIQIRSAKAKTYAYVIEPYLKLRRD